MKNLKSLLVISLLFFPLPITLAEDLEYPKIPEANRFHPTHGWANWHRSVNDELCAIVEKNCHGAINNGESKSCAWTFKVSKDGTVSQIFPVEKSTDAYFNFICINSMNSLAGKKKVIGFPSDTTATFIRDYAVFEFVRGDIHTTLKPKQSQEEDITFR